MKALHLVLKHKWYDMIDSGIKTEEYRERTPYWEKRLVQAYLNGRIDCVTFHRGYTKTTMTFRIEDLDVDYGRTYFGAPKDVVVNIIMLGERIRKR